jgi:hypothetical protein
MSSSDAASAKTVSTQFATADASWRTDALEAVTVDGSTLTVWVNRVLSPDELDAVVTEAESALSYYHLAFREVVIANGDTGAVLSTRAVEAPPQ